MKRTPRTMLSALCLLLAAFALAAAATRYVAPGGTGLGGSEDSPLGSFVTAIDGVGPGDTIVLLDGEYRETLNLSKSGTPGSVAFSAACEREFSIPNHETRLANVRNESMKPVLFDKSRQASMKAANMLSYSSSGLDHAV